MGLKDWFKRQEKPKAAEPEKGPTIGAELDPEQLRAAREASAQQREEQIRALEEKVRAAEKEGRTEDAERLRGLLAKRNE